MAAALVLTVIVLAVAFLIFMALLPTLVNLLFAAAAFWLARKATRYTMRAWLSVTLSVLTAVAASFLLGINVRLVDLAEELMTRQERFAAPQNVVELPAATPVTLVANTGEIAFKKSIFERPSHYCNPNTRCGYKKPELVKENINALVLHMGLKISDATDGAVVLVFNEIINGGVATYQAALKVDGSVIAERTYRRRVTLAGEGYQFKRIPGSKYETASPNLVHYLFSNTFWDHILDSRYGRKQDPVFEAFLKEHLRVIPATRRLSVIESKPAEGAPLEDQYRIKEYHNIYHPIGCERLDANRSDIFRQGRHESVVLTIHGRGGQVGIIEEEKHLNKIICRDRIIYFLHVSRTHPDIHVSLYDDSGAYIRTDIIKNPQSQWVGQPRVSYFEKIGDRYLIELTEYKNDDNKGAYRILLQSP